MNRKKKRDYKREEELVRMKYDRYNFKIDKKYSYIVEQIKEKEGITTFLVDCIKNYNSEYFKLTTSEGANLIAILENFLERNKEYSDKKYLDEIETLKNKINKYVDDN